MGIDNVSGTDELVESVRESTFFFPEDLPEGEDDPLEYMDSVDISLEVDNLDFETGMIELTCRIGGEHTVEKEDYLPELLGWTNPNHRVRSISSDTAGEIGKLVSQELAEKENRDAGDFLIQSVKEPYTVEYVDRGDPGVGPKEATDSYS